MIWGTVMIQLPPPLNSSVKTKLYTILEALDFVLETRSPGNWKLITSSNLFFVFVGKASW